MATIFARTIIIYAVLLIAVRVMGKRQVGELEVSELIITFLLSELAVLPLSSVGLPLTHGVIPVILLISAEVIFSYLTSKIPFVRRIMLGKPSVIIRKGKLDLKELSRLRISAAELMSELRLKGVATVDEVFYAIVEDNGQLSVFKKEDGGDGIAHFVVSDGRISDEAIRDAEIERRDVEEILKKKRTAVTDVFLMSVDDGGNVNIIMKERSKKGK